MLLKHLNNVAFVLFGSQEILWVLDVYTSYSLSLCDTGKKQLLPPVC